MKDSLDNFFIEGIKFSKCEFDGFSKYDYISDLNVRDTYIYLNYNYSSKCLGIDQIHNSNPKLKGLTKKVICSVEKVLPIKSLEINSIVEDRTIDSLNDLFLNFDVCGNFCLIGYDEKFNSPFLNSLYELGFREINVRKKQGLNSYFIKGRRI